MRLLPSHDHRHESEEFCTHAFWPCLCAGHELMSMQPTCASPDPSGRTYQTLPNASPPSMAPWAASAVAVLQLHLRAQCGLCIQFLALRVFLPYGRAFVPGLLAETAAALSSNAPETPHTAPAPQPGVKRRVHVKATQAFGVKRGPLRHHEMSTSALPFLVGLSVMRFLFAKPQFAQHANIATRFRQRELEIALSSVPAAINGRLGISNTKHGRIVFHRRRLLRSQPQPHRRLRKRLSHEGQTLAGEMRSGRSAL